MSQQRGIAMHYSVLGPVEAVRDGTSVPIGGSQQRRLLAVLLCRPDQVTTTERLVDRLWDDGLAPPGADRTVMTYVSRLRAALGTDVVSTVPGGYRLELESSGATFDARQFEAQLADAAQGDPSRALDRYDRALALWRGDAFGELGQEWWLVQEVARLDELRTVAQEERAVALVVLGQPGRAIPDLERLAEAHPLRERPVALIMQALAAAGRPAEALRVFQSFRGRLGEETGLDPSDDLVALERSIATGDAPRPAATRARHLRGYALHELLGSGAFGRVYAATQPGTNRAVAIKAIRPELASTDGFIQRFEAEARLVARLEHPHIVPLYDYWREPGGAFLVFRLLAGGTAYASLVSNGPFDVARVSRVVEEVGAALLSAHTAGVVHCDVKPSNVLFDEQGNIYLSDFGIAVASPTSDLAGDLTRAYAAPELAGRRGDTVQSDIYSFGCMLWELLAGTSPLVRMTGERSRLPSLGNVLSTPSDAIDAVLARATAFDVDQRFASMADLIVAWRDAVGRPDGVLTPIGGHRIVATDSTRRLAVRQLSAAAAVNPFKGLRAFTEADAAEFFGRTEVARHLYETLVVRRFVAVVGPSGSGKSSLVLAGLVPLLRQHGHRVVTMTPGDHPMAALHDAVRVVSVVEPPGDDPLELVDTALGDATSPLVIVVDQFEECWTLSDEHERDRFLTTLHLAVHRGVRCVATVRADLYDRPLRHALVGALVADGTFALPPLGAAALEEAVVRPAHHAGVVFEDGVVSALVGEALSQPAGLPLLQFTLAELYDKTEDGCITQRSLADSGGLGGAIGRRAEAIYAALGEVRQASARRLFGRLVAPGQGAPDTRRRARYSELSEEDRVLADRFVAGRLLVADRDQATREPVYELAHEALLSSWPRLREWLDADRRWLAQLQHVAASARTWNDAGRADSELYRGSRLEATLEGLDEHAASLADDEREFVAASRAARDASREADRRTARRLRRLLVAVGCLLVVAVATGAVAFTQRGQARSAATDARSAQRDAEIAALVGRSLSIRPTQRDVAALLAIEAHREADTPRTQSALLSTFTSDVGYLGTRQLPEALGGSTQGIVLPDGTTAMVVGSDQAIRSYDLDSGAVGDPWPTMRDQLPAGSSHFGASTDGTLVVQVFWPEPNEGSSIIGVFDTKTHRPIVPAIDVPLWADNVLVGPDGRRLYASGGRDGTVLQYSLSDGRLVGRLEGLPAPEDSELNATTAGLAFVGSDRLAVGSVAGPIRFVDPVDLHVIEQFDAPRGTTEKLVAVDHGRSLIGEGVLGRARFDLTGLSPTIRWQVGSSDQVTDDCYAFAVAEVPGVYFCGTYFGDLEERDLVTGGLVRELNGQHGNIGTIWMARGETEVVSFNDNESLVARWRIDGSGPVSRHVSTGYTPYGYSPDGRSILADHGASAAGEPDGWGIVDPASGGARLESTNGPVQFPDWRADGTLIGLTDVDSAPRYVVVDPATGATSATDVQLPKVPAQGFASRHRLWLYYPTGDNPYGKGEIWTIDTDARRRVEPTLQVDSYVSGSGTDDGDRVAIGEFDGIVVFDGRSGQQLHTITGNLVRSANVVGPDRVVAASLGGRMTVYDLTTFAAGASLGGARGYSRVVGSEDGKLAVAAGNDRRVVVYDVGSGESIGDTIVISNDEVNAVALRPDGKELALGGGAGRPFTVWDLDPDHWVQAACRIAGRNLTQQEWTTYVGDLAPYHRTCPDFD